ncbi:PilZ domain-containing protein [Parazoarcus communis]|uniref:PilZ domain-containing protein n=1 Tax=Parazoarcus communis SWub3 = DSM 12120 TaxID=1121029 RepID=A0A323UWJ2_9RHOO|nr:PilZ domain-containing protein [Parazoarcus communis]NMG69051.1 PilZ domain-containing protein [Parazoarcus communis SWub3 = DSM 12120]PZA16909.1 PilZ domain-containing protein [Azoarcus communis] [Parazoarcus communis SWub3 = DSM 12120]
MRELSRIVMRSMFRIKVYLRTENRMIGYVGDLSESGLKLLTDDPLDVGAQYALSLRMRGLDGELRATEVDGLCCWSQRGARSGHVESGLRVDVPSSAYSALIRGMRRRGKG